MKSNSNKKMIKVLRLTLSLIVLFSYLAGLSNEVYANETNNAMLAIPLEYSDYMNIKGFSFKNGKLYYYGLELNDNAMYEDTDEDGNTWEYDPLDPEFLVFFGDRINVQSISEEPEEVVNLPKSGGGSFQSSINGNWYGYPSYVNGKDYMNGVDVSYYQKNINWNALAAKGVQFAFIRAGYRGYGDSGNMKADPMCGTYIEGAYDAGIKVGIYFLSQATNNGEAAEEAARCAEIIAPYKGMISMPVIMDYEYAGSSTNPGRLSKQHTYDMNSGRDYKAIHNSVVNSFFSRMSSYGYRTGIYANKTMLESQLRVSDISSDYVVWLAHYTNSTSYDNRLEGWQYTSSYTGFGSNVGSNKVDLDFWFDKSSSGSEEDTHPDEGKVRAFVTRLYRIVLEREPDPQGHQWWVNQLMSGSKTGADVVCGFYLSDELNGRGYSNDKLVELAYKGIMDRNPDAGGKAYWVDLMNRGYSYQYVIAGFIDSKEFEDLCRAYGIKKGTSDAAKNENKIYGIRKFVERLYTKALGRAYDEGGLNYWTGIIYQDSSKANILDVSLNGFLHSDEFLGKNLDNGEYVKVLYRTFLGREAELAGYVYWVDQLNSGTNRDEVAEGFAYSEEFNDIMASYGL